MSVASLTLEVAVPEWARFVARDEDGSWFAYEERPKFDPDDGMWCPTDGRYRKIGDGMPTKVARDTLREVNG